MILSLYKISAKILLIITVIEVRGFSVGIQNKSIQMSGFLLCQFNIHSAQNIDNLDEGIEVDPDITVDPHTQAVLHFPHHQIRTAIVKAMGDEIHPAAAVFQHIGDSKTALNADKLYGFLVQVQTQQQYCVGTGIIGELKITLVCSQKKDIDNSLVINDLQIRHLNIIYRSKYLLIQPAFFQQLLSDLVHGAGQFEFTVIIIESVQLGVDKQKYKNEDHQNQEQNAANDPLCLDGLILLFTSRRYMKAFVASSFAHCAKNSFLKWQINPRRQSPVSFPRPAAAHLPCC